MEILWWLAPPVVATVLAMCWVTWLGRAGRGQVDPEVAARRLGAAMARPAPVFRTARPSGPEERGTGVAVRPSSRPAGPGATRRAS